jgi:hypothetical protein
MNLTPEIISVIASGCVAIVAVLAPLFVNSISEWMRWSRERKATEADRINQSTLDLLGAITPFMLSALSSTELATRRPWQETYIDLRSKYFAWERALWSHCKKQEREQVSGLRAKLNAMSAEKLKTSAEELAEEILSLTHAVGERAS